MPKNPSEQYVSNVTSLSWTIGTDGNTPVPYESRATQYLANRTKLFMQQRAYLATDFVKANMQGLQKDFYAWKTVKIRLSDVNTQRQTALTNQKQEDYKCIMVKDKNISYLPIGAKVETMGSTWIITNPSNMSLPKATAIAARCNVTYHSYDDYGNIVTEPMVLQNTAMLSSVQESPLNMVLMNGYFTAVCQKNENTMRLHENKRMILGNQAYFVTGYSDFAQEFTGDFDSSRLLSFTLRLEEPNETDDMVNRIAGGKKESFSVEVTGKTNLVMLNASKLTAHFWHNAEEIVSSEEHPVTFSWDSADKNVVEVDPYGMLYPVAPGSALVRVMLDQNPNLSCTIGVTVEQQPEAFVAFTSVLPNQIKQFDTKTFTASYFENGNETDAVFSWNFSGADIGTYYTVISKDTKSCSVQCLSPSNTPLTIEVSMENLSVQHTVTLEGY
jgi:hypothetical protein